ncbi:hypothetical protein G9A89_019413 [Geosiphon pyriformis]|nr:hypothetical protein G9A89_019413 [Geosiphon pyriformis]
MTKLFDKDFANSDPLFGTLEDNKKHMNKNANPKLVLEEAKLKKSPFDPFIISPIDLLETLNRRLPCPQCEKPIKYFCYRCYAVVGCERGQVPFVKLPIKIDVIKHEDERDGKSTAIHAKIIASEDVEIYSYKKYQTSEIQNVERHLLLFPGPQAKTLNHISQASFDKILVVDGTWLQASRIIRDTPSLASMRKVTLKPQKTLFWRFQNKDEHHLATIEAIYYFLKEYDETYESSGTAYNGRYDNLLWYYKFFYELIQATYRMSEGTRTFTSRQRQGYINYD